MTTSTSFGARSAPSSLAFGLALTLPLLVLGCGEDSTESTGTGGSGPGSCGTADAPDLFQLADVTPASGGAVDSLQVVHSFRVVDAPGIVQQLAFQTAASHTAGAPNPAQLSFTVTQEGADLVYTATPVTWSSAGHVELSVPTRYDVGGCIYAFPSPMFTYDLAPTEGSGGGGSGGSGEGGAGEGGAAAGGADAGSGGA